jgi:RHS repeat-associated protein
MHPKTSGRVSCSGFTKSKFVRSIVGRRLVCLLIVMSLPIWPGKLVLPSVTAKAYALDFTGAPIGYLPLVLRSLLWFTSSSQRAEDSLADRLAQVAHIRVTPNRFVAYAGQSLIYDAVGTNLAGQTIPGLVFNWESLDSSRVQIDDAGRATFVGAGGPIHIICRAGIGVAVANTLVRPGRRPIQTDAEWKADQESLPAPGTGPVGSLLPSLLDKLAPTAYAQGGGYTAPDFGYDELWSEPCNLVGSPRNRLIEPTQLGPVLPEGSNFNFSVPLIALGGRGIGATLTLYGNSRVWSRHGSAVTFGAVGGFPFAGFSMGFGRVLTYGPSNNTSFVWVEPDGTPHSLGSCDLYANATLQTTDGTNITFVKNAVYSGTLYYNDGTQITISSYNNRSLATQIKDSNGNYVGITYKYGAPSPLAIDHVTDTQGRQIQFNYDGSGNLISITAPGYGGTAQNPVTRTVAQFDYQSRTISYNFTGLTVENVPTGAVNVLRHIYFPGTSTGSLFTYSDYGMIYNLSARRQMSVDGNGVISDGVESASVSINYPTLGSTALIDSPAFTQRTETVSGGSTGVFSYSTTPGFQTLTYTVTRPDSSTLVLTRSTNASSAANGLLTQAEIKNSGGGSMSKLNTTYATDPGGSVKPQAVIAYDNTGTATKVDFDYDAHGNLTNKRDYGFQISGAWQVRRRTNYTYATDTNYTSRYLLSLMTEIKLYDALQNTSDADDVLISKTTNTFDDYSSTGGMEGYGLAKPPGHDTALYGTTFTYRGNVTGTTQWTDIAGNFTLPTKLKKYDKFGNLLQEMVACCKQKVFTYVGNDYWANPPTVTDGDPQGLHLVGSTTYDFNTGLPKYNELANLGKRYFYYDAALRLIEQDLPTGGTRTASYNDGTLTASFTKSGIGTTTNTYDGFGQVTQTVDANYGQVNTSYDSMRRVASRTNPFTAGGSPGASTVYTYDALSRVTVVTLPDNQTLLTTYSANTVTAADEVNRKIKRETDGLGRLVKVTEQDSSGSLTQETNYTYNYLDKLTLVNQGNQSRAFSYDALGRTLYERIPEQTATINDGTGTYWTTKYTYTDFSAVATRTDARGAITTYSYDAMNRPWSIIYNTTNAPGVAATPGVGYTYDNNNSSPTNGVLLAAGLESYSYDGYKRLYAITRSIDSINYTTSYQYGAGDFRSQITYPSGRVVNINRSNTGRLDSLTDGAGANYLSGLSYSAAGQLTGDLLGNGVAETYGYDANRLQLTSQTATKSGGPQNGLMNLTYNYQASPGQMGTGSTAGNAGQLMSIGGTINATTETAGYTYDNLGRLVTSDQTSNGSSAQRRFAYDRWGNRTSVWDATSGGNLIQNVSLVQSGGVPTNQIAALSNPEWYGTYTYDAAGNVTNDGVHTYQYDAENRIVNVDGGVTAQYSYDQHNRRFKKSIGNAVTHYVWEGSQVVSEHDGTGAVLSECVYSNGRMIEKFSNAVARYYVRDRLGERLVLDISGNVVGRQAHLPFGEDFGESAEQEKHHFTSYERDPEIGSDYAINRQYSQSVARFMRTDPDNGSYNFANPKSLNRYGYVGNDPLNAVDPLGLDSCSLAIVAKISGWIPGIDGPQQASVTIYAIVCVRDEVPSGGGSRIGGGGSGGKDPKKDAKSEADSRLNQFFKANPGCKTFLQGMQDPTNSKKSLYDKMMKAMSNLEVDDVARDSSLLDQNFGQLHINLNLWTNASASTPVSDLLGVAGPNIQPAFSDFGGAYSKSRIFLGIAFSQMKNNPSSEPEANQVIAHELLHIVLGTADHTQTVKALGLTSTGSDEGDFDLLKGFLLNNCGQPRK